MNTKLLYSVGYVSLVLAVTWGGVARGQDVKILCEFEEESSVKEWEIRSGATRLVEEGATQGKRALEIEFDPKGEYHGAYMFWYRVHRDWSPYDALILDVLNPCQEPVSGYTLIADKAWEEKGRSYWNRHNGGTTFAPGRTEWMIPVKGLYRGEAGSRNNDIKRNIDPDSIVRVDFGFGDKGKTGRIVIDNLRLVRLERPNGVWAFDFGPPSQPLMLGWSPVSHETRYSPQQKFGWWPPGAAPWSGAARDTTFGTPLLQDFCEAGGYNFRVDAPAGAYRVHVFYENSGYWGGEQARHRERRILANGKAVWSDTRTDGSAHALFRFENVEPVGVDLWDTYMEADLARPAVFEAEAAEEGLTFRFEADRVWGSKIAGLVLHQVDDANAEKWVKRQLEQIESEFRKKAVPLDPPAKPFDPPGPWRESGLIAWPVDIGETIQPNSVPAAVPASPDAVSLSRTAVRGEYEAICLALRPQVDLGECHLSLEPFPESARLSSKVQVVWYNTSRDFSSVAYHIRPHTLREQAKVALPKDVTREIVVTVRVREDAPAGDYRAALVIQKADGSTLLKTPLRLSVKSVTLSRKTDYLMGFFGLMPTDLLPEERRWDALEEILEMLQSHGMNAVSGGPSWQLKGWKDGKPEIDFGEMDRFFELLRKHGFTGAINGYGGLRFSHLHQGYEKGEAAATVERESGKPYAEAFMLAWKELDAHARQANWPTLFYAMCDETRVRDAAERELEFMQLMAKASNAYPLTVRTSGSYSVHFNQRPANKDDLLYWHQRFFEALDVSSLNLHDESVMAEAKRLGKEIHIYNQGTSRYSFGLYQWSEYRKGVRARWQWHLDILHGYQFFDLDGREPDTAMICYGRNAIYPTIHLERCREGAEDFYLFQTLWNLVEEKRKQGAPDEQVIAAGDLLKTMEAQVKLSQRTPPEGFDADALKAKVIEAIEKM